MTVKIKVSYKTEEEKSEILLLLRPITANARVRHSVSDPAHRGYKRLYITLCDGAKDSPLVGDSEP